MLRSGQRRWFVSGRSQSQSLRAAKFRRSQYDLDIITSADDQSHGHCCAARAWGCWMVLSCGCWDRERDAWQHNGSWSWYDGAAILFYRFFFAVDK